MCYWEENISEQIRIYPLQTVLLSLPFNKLPCPQNVDCMTLGYSLGNLSMSGTSTSITPRCFFFSVLQAAKPWNTFHGFRTKQAWKKTDGEGQQNKAIPIRSLILESSSVFLSCDERALSTLKKSPHYTLPVLPVLPVHWYRVSHGKMTNLRSPFEWILMRFSTV